MNLATIRVSALSSLTALEQDEVLDELTRRQDLVTIRYRQLPPGTRGAPPRAEREVVRDGRCLDVAVVLASDGCLACGLVDDLRLLLPQLVETGWARDVVVAPPPGVSAHAVLDGCAAVDVDRIAPTGLRIGTAMVAVDPAAVEDQLWSSETLADARVALADADITLGEFLVGELLLADTYALVMTRPAADGVELLRQLAPQSRVVAVGPHPAAAPWPGPSVADTFDEHEADVRTDPAAIMVPVGGERDEISTHVVRIERPLHPGRLAVAMHTAAAGCVWSRGRMWIASMPARRIGWTGVGPNISFTDAGGWLADGAERYRMDSLALLSWHPEYGDRSTVLAFTGRELEPAELEASLQVCQLSEAELALGLEHWAAQPDPLNLRSSFSHLHDGELESQQEKE